VIGRLVARGGQEARPYNHYSLLLSPEDIYGI
jgi:hypothetical protein